MGVKKDMGEEREGGSWNIVMSIATYSTLSWWLWPRWPYYLKWVKTLLPKSIHWLNQDNDECLVYFQGSRIIIGKKQNIHQYFICSLHFPALLQLTRTMWLAPANEMWAINVSYIQANIIKSSCNILSSPAHVPEGAAIDHVPSAWIPDSICGTKASWQFIL